mmetsp:Transcript_1267/g.1320  ORF Transcript_1267/g.1320 Transcript_1267/m.1320 type:complete len:178 (+) Transcript_1267:14-547(+)|eukprot:gene467-500_t
MAVAQHGRDILLSIVAGFVIALGIITVSGEKKAPKSSQTSKTETEKKSNKESSSEKEEKKKTNNNQENSSEISPEVSDQLKKSPTLRKFFGVKDENSLEEEIKKIEEISKVPEKEKYEPEEDISEHFEETILPIISLVIYTIAGAIAIYLGNLATNGLFFQVFVGLFPKEAKTLKII